MAARRGNVFRLPVPPKLSTSVTAGPQNAQLLNDHLGQVTDIVNQALQSLQNRVNSIQQVTAKTPPTVTGLTVTGKQGLFYLTWNRIANTDGYVVTQASDPGMVQLIGRYTLPDGNQVTHQVPVGNVAVKNYFQVYAFQGQKMSDPSAAVSATTATFTTSESAPPTPPIAPLQPKVSPPRSGPNL